VPVVELVGLVVSIGLADSLNPATLAPALYFSTGPNRVGRVAEFTAAFFALNLAGGTLLALGPGRLVLALIPHPGASVKHVFELAAGVALLAAATALWLGRGRLSSPAATSAAVRPGSAAALGASIAAVELPTAVPYFVVIAAVVGSGTGIVGQVALIAQFNAAFVAPLLALILGLAVLRDRADETFERANAWLRQRWPVPVAILLGLAGAVLLALGAAGLSGM